MKRFLFLLILLGAVCHVDASRWVGTWATAPQLVETNNMPPSPGLTNNSLRQVLKVSIGGDTLRMKFSNEFSNDPVTMLSVKIAVSKGGGVIDAATQKTLSFQGQTSVTMGALTTVWSDALAFHLDPRMELAVTICFGSVSATLTGHPGSRTTSYILAGNDPSVVDFSSAVTTDHWYVINGIDVKAPETSSSVAILGNSITDGRGSDTNQQNRWTDIFSQRLLNNPASSGVGVLNMGIGGNCILAGGLGPTGVSRYERDVLQQSGIRWVVIFEGVNDMGGITDINTAVNRSNSLISAYQQMIRYAHARNIRAYGATIMPFKNNSYYTVASDSCRRLVNKWIRTGGWFDAVIDFDKTMRDPQDTISMAASLQADYLHPNAAGHRLMGESVPVKLFEGGDTVFTSGSTDVFFWFEAERFVTATDGSNYSVVNDQAASNGKYITARAGLQSTASAPTASADLIVVPFTIEREGAYQIFARLRCPSYNDDSFWLRTDQGAFGYVNGLMTTTWAWLKMGTSTFSKGQHSITIGYREDGACLDKLCITTGTDAPLGTGLADPLLTGLKPVPGDKSDWTVLGPGQASNVIQVNYSLSQATYRSIRLYHATGKLAAVLEEGTGTPGNYSVEKDVNDLPEGLYLCVFRSGNQTSCRKILVNRQ